MSCDGNTPALSAAEAEAHAANLEGWTLEFPKLRFQRTFKDFRAALAWINRVGMLAEQENHHPDFHLTSWNQVELVLYTHAIDGLSLQDMELARKITSI